MQLSCRCFALLLLAPALSVAAATTPAPPAPVANAPSTDAPAAAAVPAAPAAPATATPPRERYPCRAGPQHRAFDFWLGTWDVSLAGKVVGRSVITSDLEGCVLREHWSTPKEEGTSVNFYDPATRRWHQVWTADNGVITHYVGNFEDGAMRFLAQGFGDADGVTRHRRMTFTPNADGSVRQFFEESTDGQTWTPSFDGLYRKATE